MAISEGYLRHGRGFYHAITCIFDFVVEVGGAAGCRQFKTTVLIDNP